MEHNGWENKETFLAYQWLEPYLTEDLRAGAEVTATEVKDALNNMRADAKDMCGLFSDFIDAALDRVACYEIAEHITEKSRRAGRRT
jgi:hypothetical protein